MMNMKVKTESGVLISFISRGSSKTLLFDKPVRAMELKKEELTRIAALLSPNLEVNKPRIRKSPSSCLNK
jgi:hypothetical protein